MVGKLLLVVALAMSAPTGAHAAAAGSAPRSSLRDQGAARVLDLGLGESVVLSFDREFKPVLRSASLAAGDATAARLPAPIDLESPETKTGVVVADKGSDPRRLDKAAPGTVVMTLVPYRTGTLLLVENGLDIPVRYHAATMQAAPGGGARGASTTLCPAKPGIGTVETWAARFTSLLVVRFERAAPGDEVCRM